MALFDPSLWYSIRPTAYPGLAVAIFASDIDTIGTRQTALVQTQNITNADGQLFQFYPTAIGNSTFAIRCNVTGPDWYASIEQSNVGNLTFMIMNGEIGTEEDPRTGYWTVSQVDNGFYQMTNSHYEGTTNFVYANSSFGSQFVNAAPVPMVTPDNIDAPFIGISGYPLSTEANRNTTTASTLSASNYVFSIVSTGISIYDQSFGVARLPLTYSNISLPQPPSSNKSNIPKAAIAVATIIPALLVLVAFALIWRIRQRRRRAKATQQTKEKEDLDPMPYVTVSARDQGAQTMGVAIELSGCPGGQELCGSHGGHELNGGVAAPELLGSPSGKELHGVSGIRELHGSPTEEELPALPLYQELYGSSPARELHEAPARTILLILMGIRHVVEYI